MAMQHRKWFIEAPNARFSEAALPAPIEGIGVSLRLAGKERAHDREFLVILDCARRANNVAEGVFCAVDYDGAARAEFEVAIFVCRQSLPRRVRGLLRLLLEIAAPPLGRLDHDIGHGLSTRIAA